MARPRKTRLPQATIQKLRQLTLTWLVAVMPPARVHPFLAVGSLPFLFGSFISRDSECLSSAARARALAPTLEIVRNFRFPLLGRGIFLRRRIFLLALAFLLRLHFGLWFGRRLRFGFGIAFGDGLVGGSDGGLRHSSAATIGEDHALQFSGLAVRVDHDEVEAGAVEQRHQRFADG